MCQSHKGHTVLPYPCHSDAKCGHKWMYDTETEIGNLNFYLSIMDVTLKLGQDQTKSNQHEAQWRLLSCKFTYSHGIHSPWEKANIKVLAMIFWMTSCHYTDSHVSYQCIKKQNHTTKTAEKEEKKATIWNHWN